MAAEHFDAIVVGAGPAGASAALVLASSGLSVALLDRGEFPGAKNMFGGVLYRHAIEALVGEAWKENGFPVERVVTEQRYWLLGPESMVTVGHRHEAFGREPNAWTAFRARFDPWFAAKAEQAGALGVYQTTVVDLLRDPKTGRVTGVLTDRDEGELYADVVVIADGVNSLLREKLGLPRWRPDQVSLAVKEVLALPRETIESRFNLEGNEGVTIEFLGDTSQGMVGLGFLYTNKESLSLGIGVMIDDLARHRIAPYELLESVKRHPMIRRLIAGAESVEYSAHMIPEGAYDALPPALAGDGWVLCGDAAGLVNFLHREGTNLAMLSGQMAGRVIAEAHRRGDLSARSLMAYDRELRASAIGRDLRRIRRMPSMLHRWGGRRLFGDLVGGINRAAYRYFLADGTPKRQAEAEALREIVRAAGGWRPLMRLAWDGFRGVRG
ncbi:FAD-dependent oxidoreductase [Carboxydochorda subterranea]|uniref:FAD-dependent oxidoreductase n=1 Tax=Carboxydichorda subterranea TaxID=3109565 RepID=A0ABZ1BWD9_9FIRM|nr:FAD-dependent oxidoreductase [Limnochorda sp. L945t]WRP17001.1 FAD-dependent oxidoreductase [Limnochorda sp. L945t]